LSFNGSGAGAGCSERRRAPPSAPRVPARCRTHARRGYDTSGCRGSLQSLLKAFVEELRWAEHHAPAAYQVLNACRGRLFLESGILGSKIEGGDWARSRAGNPSVVEAALRHRCALTEAQPDPHRDRDCLLTVLRRLETSSLDLLPAARMPAHPLRTATLAVRTIGSPAGPGVAALCDRISRRSRARRRRLGRRSVLGPGAARTARTASPGRDAAGRDARRRAGARRRVGVPLRRR
jgi:hypothetical protein